MKRIAFLVFLIMFSLGELTATHAQQPVSREESIGRIKNYVGALQSNDRNAVYAAWQKLDASPETIEFMRKNYPYQYRSYRLQGKAYRLESLGRNASNTTLIESSGITTKTNKGNLTTKDLVDHGRTSNQDAVRNSPNQNRAPNGDVVRDNPNQKRTSNQDLIRSRIR